jgi:hypothetical protein
MIAAYRQGVQVMKSRAISNPTSWLYQAAIHGTNLTQNQWPANAPFGGSRRKIRCATLTRAML